MRLSIGRAVVVVGLLVGVAGSGVRGREAEQSISLAAPGGSSANVSLAAGDGRVAAVWTARAGDETNVYCAVSSNGGKDFSSAVRVNDVPGDVSLYAEQPPRVAVAAPAILVTWASKHGKTASLRIARSIDGGRSFERATTLDPRESVGRGWQSMAAGPAGELYTTWLEAIRPGAPKAVVTARWQDRAIVARRLTESACDCCKTATAVGQDGRIYVAWRHVYPDGSRDIAFAFSRDGLRFEPPVRVSRDGWKIEGCPDDGPTMAVDARNTVHIVWPSAGSADGSVRLYHASTRDGIRFSPRDTVPTLATGRPAHPQMAADRGGVVLAWDETGGGARRIASSQLEGGTTSTWTPPAMVSDAGTAGVYPVVVAVPAGALVAWTAGNAGQTRIAVRTVPFRHVRAAPRLQ